MKLFIIGASGRVGTIVTPFLKQQHTLRIYDMKPPADSTLDYWAGDINDYETLKAAMAGMDALLYMAMNVMYTDELTMDHSAFDVNVKGVFMALKAAHAVGIPHAVHCSSMSVYDGNLNARYFFDEAMTPDARDLYGFTKRLGEEVCYNAWASYGMSVNALRMCFPIPHEKYLEQARLDTPSLPTDAEDVARLMLAALEYRNGFQAFQTSGDYANRIINMGKAKRLLGWEPLARPAQ